MQRSNSRITAILLAGGAGTRMQEHLPKQFLLLGGKPIIQYSLEILSAHPSVVQLVIVCAPEYQDCIDLSKVAIPVDFALPGARRQDSLKNGMAKALAHSDWICVHDAARPFLTEETLEEVIQAAFEVGAATAALPCINTIKESSEEQLVVKTLDRAALWEIQTPQILRKEWLEEGFRLAEEKDFTVTDDVSIAELLGKPVKLVNAPRDNFKITLPFDLLLAECILQSTHPALK